MFRLPISWDDGAPLANWDLSRFFSINNPLRTETFTYDKVLRLLKAIYTKENLEINPKLLIPSCFYYDPFYADPIVRNVINNWPEDKYWTLAFVEFDCIPGRSSSARNNYSLLRAVSWDTVNAAPRWTLDFDSLGFDLHTNTPFTQAQKTKLESLANRISTSLYTVLVDRLNNSFRPGNWDTVNNANLLVICVNAMIRWLAGGNVIRNRLGPQRQTGAGLPNVLNVQTLTDNWRSNWRIETSLDSMGFWGGIAVLAEFDPNDRSQLYQVFSYTTDVFNLLGGHFYMEGESKKQTRMYGVELECSTEYEPREMIEAQKDVFFVLKSDASVNGSKRFKYECVTRPMSLRTHRKQWAYFFSQLDYGKFDTTKNTNNGLHVHISREAFADTSHLRRFTWFFTSPGHQPFMTVLSDRNENSIRTYATFPQLSGTRGGNFHEVISRVADVRGCINLQKRNTVEVRLFKGIVSYANIMANLELVDSVLEYSLLSGNRPSLRGYWTWMLSLPRNRYMILKKHLEMKGIEDHFYNSEVEEIIQGIKAPSNISKRINNSGLKIEVEHLHILNQKYGVFEISKDGRLISKRGDRKRKSTEFPISNVDLQSRVLRGLNATAQ